MTQDIYVQKIGTVSQLSLCKAPLGNSKDGRGVETPSKSSHVVRLACRSPYLMRIRYVYVNKYTATYSSESNMYQIIAKLHFDL